MFARDMYASVIHVALFFFFLLTGSFFLAVSLFSDYRYHSFRLFLDHPAYSFAVAFFLFALCISVLFLFSHKNHLRFQMNAHAVDIDRKVIHGYVEHFWKDEFPGVVKNFDLYILPDNTLEIAVQLQPMDQGERRRFLEKSEYGLGKILSSFLDYHQKFYITLYPS